jgi:predicted  nucleic acid-binding Zn-ribbon protein
MQTKAYLGGAGLLLLALPTTVLASPLKQTISQNLSAHQQRLSFLTSFQARLNQTQGLLDPGVAYPSLQATYQEWLTTSQAITNLTKQIGVLKTQLAAKQTDLDQTLVNQAQLNDHLAAVKLQLQDLSANKAELTQELADLKEQLANASAQPDELTARIAELTAKLAQLTDQLAELTKTQADLEDNLTELATKLARLKEELVTMTAQLNLLTSQLNQLEAKQAQLVARFHSTLASLISQEQTTVTNLTNQLKTSQQHLTSQPLTLRTAKQKTSVSFPPSPKQISFSQPYQVQANPITPLPVAKQTKVAQAKKPSASQAKGDGKLASYTAPQAKFAKKEKHHSATSWLYSLLAAAFALFSAGFFYQRTRRD